MIKIKSISGSIIYESEKDNLRDAVIDAVSKGVSLTRADLTRANLTGANLTGADLTWANLTWADLTWANLTWANLTGADLTWANLTGANLTRANLTGANLTRADLTRANLTEADLTRAIRNGKIIKHGAQWLGLYKYRVMALIYDDGSTDIEMGCFTRSLEDWKNDFWNNPKEFPNDGREASMMRLAAFEYACKWIEIKTKTT